MNAKLSLEIPLRIIVVQPVKGVVYAIQRGKSEIFSTTIADETDIGFGLTARIAALSDDHPNLLGPFVQGPRGGRFVYVNTGSMAGQVGTCWTRRAKISLQGINWELIKEWQSAPSSVLEVRISGRAKDGGPVCASVPLLQDGWSVVSA